MPNTVLGALISASIFSFDPFYSTNLKLLPGSGSYYRWGSNFGNVVTPPDSPFGRPWYYRTEFEVPKSSRSGAQFFDLTLKGVTYGAEVWLNGIRLATPQETAGTYRTFNWDISKVLHRKKKSRNSLVVQVGVPKPTDLTASWVDWNPTPQDKNMGLWQDVVLSEHGAVSIEHPVVLTMLTGANLTNANLTVEADLTNHSSKPVKGEAIGHLLVAGQTVQFDQAILLKALETKHILFAAKQYASLRLKNPPLWWPTEMGEPHLHSLNLKFVLNNEVSDEKDLKFGIRQITSEVTPEGSRLFKVNGRNLQIRGAGWASDLFLRFSRERTEQQFEYIKDLGLNTVRLEGQFEPDEFLDIADQEGVLVMTGWVCCNAWQLNAKWTPETKHIADASTRDQIYRFRTHPSTLAFLYGSDEAPEADVEKIYVTAFRDLHWQTPYISSAAATTTALNGASGFKMNGPYDYEPPSYWYIDKNQHGGAWGFNTETSPGPSIPPIESLREFIPKDHMWPIDEVWNFHCGEQEFQSIVNFKKGLDLRYGESHSAEEFAMKSQVMGYDNHRAMFEAFSKNKYRSATGIIQWMLNNSWPSLIWHLYDYYLRPGGTYYGVKKANEQLHLQYSYDDNSIYLVNRTQVQASNLRAQVQVFDLKMHAVFDKTFVTRISADSSQEVTRIPALSFSSKTYFVKTTLTDSTKKIVDNNFYWLSTSKEVYDWPKSTWARTPVLAEADLTELQTLPLVKVNLRSAISEQGQSGFVDLRNSDTNLAFFVHLKLVDSATGKEILPILWQDNYVSLIPGERRHIEVKFPGTSPILGHLVVEMDGWNVAPTLH